jgi:hypothetical protein
MKLEVTFTGSKNLIILFIVFLSFSMINIFYIHLTFDGRPDLHEIFLCKNRIASLGLGAKLSIPSFLPGPESLTNGAACALRHTAVARTVL